jgi:hypothetical protein
MPQHAFLSNKNVSETTELFFYRLIAVLVSSDFINAGNIFFFHRNFFLSLFDGIPA